MREEDFSLEDNKELMNEFSSLANSEYKTIVERLKYERRKAQLLFLRAFKLSDRREFKAKHGIK